MHIRWRGLELPSTVVCDAATLTPTYGKFVVEPFERGFGSTIGNGLRRILLSSLEGSAITQIKVHNAQHEFTTIKGVLEDITDIVLNVKSLVVKNHSDSTRVLRVEKNTAGPITGCRHRNRRSGRNPQPGPSARHAHRRRAVRDGNGRRERPRLRPLDRAQPEHPGDRHHSDRRGVQPGRPRAIRHRGNPRRSEDELRQADDGNLDQRLGRAGDGAGRVGQDSPQAPQSVRAVHRARPAGPLAGPRHECRHRRRDGSQAEHEPVGVECCRCGPATAWNRKTS